MSNQESSEPLIPSGTVPRAVLGLHVFMALALGAMAVLALQSGQVVQTAVMFLMSGMILTAGIAAGRIVARR
jgi:hypothetical protein